MVGQISDNEQKDKSEYRGLRVLHRGNRVSLSNRGDEEKQDEKEKKKRNQSGCHSGARC